MPFSIKTTAMKRRRARESGAGTSYLTVLATAILCYAALGTVLGILPDYVHSLGGGAVLVGFAVGAPALTGAAGRPLGGQIADRVGPAQVVIAGALVMAVGTIPAYVERSAGADREPSRRRCGRGRDDGGGGPVAAATGRAGPARPRDGSHRPGQLRRPDRGTAAVAGARRPVPSHAGVDRRRDPAPARGGSRVRDGAREGRVRARDRPRRGCRAGRGRAGRRRAARRRAGRGRAERRHGAQCLPGDLPPRARADAGQLRLRRDSVLRGGRRDGAEERDRGVRDPGVRSRCDRQSHDLCRNTGSSWSCAHAVGGGDARGGWTRRSGGGHRTRRRRSRRWW